MKNFNYNLLLATTAILSTTLALNAMALETQSVNVSVDIVPMTSLEVLQEPYMGRLVLSKDVTSGYNFYEYGFTVDTNGQLVEGDSTKGRILTNATDGKLNVSCSMIDKETYGFNIITPKGRYIPIEYKCVDDEDGKALLKLSKVSNSHSGQNQALPEFVNDGGGELTGSFTVTAVYPVATSDGGE